MASTILEDTEGGLYIPDGYHGLIWNNFAELDGVNLGQPSGYGAGVVSPPTVAFNAGGYPAGLIAPGPFSLLSAYLTAAWNDNLQVEVIGYAGAEVGLRQYLYLECDPTNPDPLQL